MKICYTERETKRARENLSSTDSFPRWPQGPELCLAKARSLSGEGPRSDSHLSGEGPGTQGSEGYALALLKLGRPLASGAFIHCTVSQQTMGKRQRLQSPGQTWSPGRARLVAQLASRQCSVCAQCQLPDLSSNNRFLSSPCGHRASKACLFAKATTCGCPPAACQLARLGQDSELETPASIPRGPETCTPRSFLLVLT